MKIMEFFYVLPVRDDYPLEVHLFAEELGKHLMAGMKRDTIYLAGIYHDSLHILFYRPDEGR